MRSAFEGFALLVLWFSGWSVASGGGDPSLEERAILGRYVGAWEGRYVLRVPGGEPLETIKILAVYEWEGDRVVGWLERRVGEETSTTEVELGMGEAGLWMRGMSSGGTKSAQLYRGEILANAIEWMPVREDSDGSRGGIFRDYFLRTADDRRQIATRALDTIELPDGTRLTVQMEGFLIRLKDSGTVQRRKDGE